MLSLKEFAKTFNFTVTPYQEAFLEFLISNSSIKLSCESSYKSEKSRINDEFTCAKLVHMKIGDKFILCTPAGSKVFKLVKVTEYK